MVKNTEISKTKISIFKPFIAFITLLLLFGSHSIYAQGFGSITGRVVDKASGEPLIGVTVYLEGTSVGTITNADGEYIIHKVSPGEYKISVKYIGYNDQSIPATVAADGKVELNFEMEYVIFEGEEIVITAQAKGQLAAINQQKASNTITNVVSSDKIQDVPDVNAAESVARLPGISLIRSGGEGQKVAIRGLSPKYNVMTVNGVRMQSTDRDDRSVDLNMIAPNILSGIEVTKALTANMDADAVGGTVNLKIGKADEGFKGKFSLQGGYGSMANTYGNYRANGMLSNRFFNNKLGIQLSGYMDHFNRDSDVLKAAYNINRENVDTIKSELDWVTFNDKVTSRERKGGGLILDYQFSRGSLIMNNFVSNLSQNEVEQQNSLDQDNNQWSAFAADREMSNTVISNALQGEFDFSLFSMDFSISNSISTQYIPGDLRMNIGIQQAASAFTTPTLAEPRQATPGEFLEAVVFTPAPDEIRVQRFYTLERDVTEAAQAAVLNFNVPFNFSQTVSGNLKLGGKYVRNSRDNDETQHYNQPDRTFIGEEFVRVLKDSLWTDLGLENFDQNLGIRAFLFEDENYDVGTDFLAGEQGIDDFYYKADIWKMNHFEELAMSSGYYPLAGKESAQYDYDYKRTLYAFYTMAVIDVGKYVTLFPGIRYENFKFNYNAFFTQRFGPNPEDFLNEELTDDSHKGENWFPQMHVRVKPTDWFDIRLASTKSIIYPDYRAVSPYIYYDSYGAPALDLGNPALKPALSQNYDVYFTLHIKSANKNHIGLFTGGYFYKEIDNLIVLSSFRTRNSEKINDRFELSQVEDTDINTWINLDATSTVRGFELDWQSSFWYLPSFLKGFVLSVNYTHIDSETSYPFQFRTTTGTGPFATPVDIDTVRSGSMINQPDDVLNITLGYDIGSFSARLSFVYQDNVLVTVDRTYPEKDAFTEGSYRWDFTAYQKLPWLNKRLQLFMNVNNITNIPDRAYSSVLKKLSSANYYGRTIDLGIRYEFK